MNLKELIEELQQVIESDEELEDAEVMLAFQPNWPLAFTIDTVTVDHTDEKKKIIWIAEGGHPRDVNPYAPKFAWDGGEVFADDVEEEENDR